MQYNNNVKMSNHHNYYKIFQLDHNNSLIHFRITAIKKNRKKNLYLSMNRQSIDSHINAVEKSVRRRSFLFRIIPANIHPPAKG